MRGSEHNDLFATDLRLRTNNSGGSLGGISTGETFEFKVAFKPVSTIAKTQLTSSL
jgi:chorismate synthase